MKICWLKRKLTESLRESAVLRPLGWARRRSWILLLVTTLSMVTRFAGENIGQVQGRHLPGGQIKTLSWLMNI